LATGRRSDAIESAADEVPEQELTELEVSSLKGRVVRALVAGIRRVSSASDREEIIRWFLNAREILGRDSPKKEIARALYDSVDTKRFANLLGNLVLTSVRNYKDSKLPLPLKVSLPVTMAGAAVFGLEGAGLAIFGGAIGLPVVLLLFLGTAGVTAVVEAFIKDKDVRDPLTKLLLAMVQLETARRAKKELLDALRAEVMIPQRAEVPDDPEALLPTLLNMDPVAFERHIMTFFERDGQAAMTAKSNDFGVDGFVTTDEGIIVVQCKRYSLDHPVGRPAIQQFKGVIEEQEALKGYFVTTSRFTQEAHGSAGKSSKLVLVDGEALVRWHQQGRRAGE
jgi:hypothetical protein